MWGGSKRAPGSSVLLFAMVGVVTAFAVWRITRSTEQQGTVAAPSRRAIPAEPLPSTNSVENEIAPERRTQDERPAKTATESSEEQTHEASPSPTSLEELLDRFESKYRGYSVADLREAEEKIARAIEEPQRKALQELYELGFYESFPYEYDANGTPKAFGDTELTRAASNDHYPAEARPGQVFNAPEAGEYRLVRLPRDGYTELYALTYERAWLVNFRLESMRFETDKALQATRTGFFDPEKGIH
jgi:hypothetical protein